MYRIVITKTDDVAYFPFYLHYAYTGLLNFSIMKKKIKALFSKSTDTIIIFSCAIIWSKRLKEMITCINPLYTCI